MGETKLKIAPHLHPGGEKQHPRVDRISGRDFFLLSVSLEKIGFGKTIWGKSVLEKPILETKNDSWITILEKTIFEKQFSKKTIFGKNWFLEKTEFRNNRFWKNWFWENTESWTIGWEKTNFEKIGLGETDFWKWPFRTIRWGVAAPPRNYSSKTIFGNCRSVP